MTTFTRQKAEGPKITEQNTTEVYLCKNKQYSYYRTEKKQYTTQARSQTSEWGVRE